MKKLVIKGNFFLLLNQDDTEFTRHPKSDTNFQIYDESSADPIFNFYGLTKDFAKNSETASFKISELTDENGAPYPDAETLVTALDSSLGFNPASGGSGAVDSVNGKTGDVTLNTDEIPEGNNKYFSQSNQNDLDSKVQSVSGAYVDDSDPKNPIINLPKYVSLQAGITRPNQTTIPLANQQGNSNYEEYLKLSYPCTVTDNYQVSIAFQWSANTANTNAKFRLVLTDGTVTQFQEVRIEAKDIGGQGQDVDVLENGVIVGQVDTNTDIILQEYFPVDAILEAGKNYDVSLEFGHESAGSEITVYSSTIRIEQKTINI